MCGWAATTRRRTRCCSCSRTIGAWTCLSFSSPSTEASSTLTSSQNSSVSSARGSSRRPRRQGPGSSPGEPTQVRLPSWPHTLACSDHNHRGARLVLHCCCHTCHISCAGITDLQTFPRRNKRNHRFFFYHPAKNHLSDFIFFLVHSLHTSLWLYGPIAVYWWLLIVNHWDKSSRIWGVNDVRSVCQVLTTWLNSWTL